MKIKKILTIFFVLLITTGVSNPVFCNDYHPSIVTRSDVTIIDVEGYDDVINVVEDSGISYVQYTEKDLCYTTLKLTPYVSRNANSDDHVKQGLEDAMEQIEALAKSNRIYELNKAEIDAVAKKKNVDISDLVVRDLFDISKYNDPGVAHSNNLHDVEGISNVILETSPLDNFVCLVHNFNGTWHVVDDCIVLDNTHLKISVESLSPFAIIVKGSGSVDEKFVDLPITGIEGKGTTITDIRACDYHWYMLVVTLISFVLCQFIRNNKKAILIRNIIALVSIVTSIVLYLFGSCIYDLYAIIIEILIVLLILYFTYKK